MPRLLLLTALACARVPAVGPDRLAAMHQAKDDEAMRACTMLGRFVGSSTQPGEKGLSQARDEARAKVAATGATDFVYDNESVTPDVITVRYAIGIFHGQVLCALGSFVHVFVERTTRKPTPIPPAIREALARIATTS